MRCHQQNERKIDIATPTESTLKMTSSSITSVASHKMRPRFSHHPTFPRRSFPSFRPKVITLLSLSLSRVPREEPKCLSFGSTHTQTRHRGRREKENQSCFRVHITFARFLIFIFSPLSLEPSIFDSLTIITSIHLLIITVGFTLLQCAYVR